MACTSQASGVSVGGTALGAGNVISGNGEYGVLIESGYYYGLYLPANDNAVEGNLIGTDVTGTLPLGMGSGGVAIFGGDYRSRGQLDRRDGGGCGQHHRFQ